MPGTNNTMTWQGNQLMSIGGVNASYTYDRNGLRTGKTTPAGTTRYYYQNGQLVRQEGPGGSWSFVYDAAGKPWYMDNGWEYYFEYNAQGDVVAILNAAEQKIVDYKYDAWGKLLSVTPMAKGNTTLQTATTIAEANPFRYRGYVYDQETGWYYLKTRYYDPELKRFVSSDALMSTGQGLLGLNMYAYCLNNPINRSDPDGMCSHTKMDNVTCNACAKAATQTFYIGNTKYTVPKPKPKTVAGGSGDVGSASWVAAQKAAETKAKAGVDPAAIVAANRRSKGIFITGEEALVLDYGGNCTYNGVPVVWQNKTGSSCAIGGTIWLHNDVNTSLYSAVETANVIKHEYGHTQQEKEYGVKLYGVLIAIPSLINYQRDINGTLNKDYYDYWHESDADRRGGVIR